MLHHPKLNRRQGTTLVESAIIYWVTFTIAFALIVGAMGVFRYNEIAHLAREGARYAATHGGQYSEDGQQAIASGAANSSAWQTKLTNEPPITSNADLLPIITRHATLLDPSKLTVTVSWTAPANYSPRNYPNYADMTTTPPGENVIYNNVIVTVQYNWLPELFLIGPIPLSSTSQMPMAY